MPSRFLFFILLIIVAEYYSFVLIRSAVKSLPGVWRTGLLVTYVLLTLLTWSSLILFRRIDWSGLPHFARNIFIAFTMGFFVGKILIAVVMLVDDLRRLFLWLINLFFNGGEMKRAEAATGQGIPRSRFLKMVALGLGGTALGGFIYGITNRYNYRIRQVALKFPNLPAAFRGMKVVQISDIHSGSFDNPDAIAKGVHHILEQQPDLILFTGDLVNNKADEMADYKSIFAQLKAPMGVYSTLGNHDYGDYVQWESAAAKVANLEHLKHTHAEMGWRLMMNEHVVLERNGENIALIGIENWGAKAGFPKYGNMQQATAGLAEKNVPFSILMSHDPSHWDAQVKTEYPDVDLTLSGHTHGMQFGIEIPGFKWSPIKYVYRQWAGLYQTGKQYLYVNRGFGFLGYPGRLGILPEITVITLS